MLPPVISVLLAFVATLCRSSASLRLENLALRHQLAVYKQRVPRPRLRPSDRVFWAWLSRLWSGWQAALAFVQPRTVIAWQRKRFRDHWRRLSQQGTPGRPAIIKEVRDLIRAMWQANPTWGSPRIVGELRKLGLNVAKSTVEKYRPRVRKPSSPTWKTFLTNHVHDIVACDFFIVPTATFRVLFVFILLAHERRRIVHFNITEHPTAQWTAQQIVEAFPGIPRRATYYGTETRSTAPHSNHGSRTWVWKRSRLHPTALGRIPTARGSSGVSGAMCSIMSSSSTTGISGACSPRIFPITAAFVPICHSIWIAPTPALSSHQK